MSRFINKINDILINIYIYIYLYKVITDCLRKFVGLWKSIERLTLTLQRNDIPVILQRTLY